MRARGHFPTEQAALKCLYLVTRSLDPTGRGRAKWAVRCKPAMNAFAITFEGRIVPSTNPGTASHQRPGATSLRLPTITVLGTTARRIFQTLVTIPPDRLNTAGRAS